MRQKNASTKTEAKMDEQVLAITINDLDGQVMPTKNQNVESLLTNKELCDVTFRVGNESVGVRDFCGIRALFACQSEIFKLMLFGKMSESKPNSVVIINDIDPTSFEIFQKYCYGLNPLITMNNVVSLLSIGDKYLIPNLQGLCMKFIKHFVIDSDRIINVEFFIKLLVLLFDKGLTKDINVILYNYQSVKTLSQQNCINIIKCQYFNQLHYTIIQTLLFGESSKFIEYIVFNNARDISHASIKYCEKNDGSRNHNRVTMELVWYMLIQWCKYQSRQQVQQHASQRIRPYNAYGQYSHQRTRKQMQQTYDQSSFVSTYNNTKENAAVEIHIDKGNGSGNCNVDGPVEVKTGDIYSQGYDPNHDRAVQVTPHALVRRQNCTIQNNASDTQYTNNAIYSENNVATGYNYNINSNDQVLGLDEDDDKQQGLDFEGGFEQTVANYTSSSLNCKVSTISLDCIEDYDLNEESVVRDLRYLDLMKKYFIEPNLLPLDQINPKFYFLFIDPIADKLFTLSQLNQILRRSLMTCFTYNSRAFQCRIFSTKKAMDVYDKISNNEIPIVSARDRDRDNINSSSANRSMVSWFTTTPFVAIWNKKGDTFNKNVVEFSSDSRVHFKQCTESSLVMADHCITNRDCLNGKFSWEIIVHKYSKDSVIGFVDALKTVDYNKGKSSSIWQSIGNVGLQDLYSVAVDGHTPARTRTPADANHDHHNTDDAKQQTQAANDAQEQEEKEQKQDQAQREPVRRQRHQLRQGQQAQQAQQRQHQVQVAQPNQHAYLHVDLSYYWNALRDFVTNVGSLVYSFGENLDENQGDDAASKTPDGFKIIDYQPNKAYVFRFEIDFTKNQIQVFENGKPADAMFENVGGGIIPAVSTNGGEAEYSIRFYNE